MPRHLVIIGAGPIGLEAAVRALDAGHRVTLIERDRVAANVRRWGHVRFFSPWSMNVSDRGREICAAAGHAALDLEAFPTGFEFADAYLEPLAAHVRTHGALVEGVSVTSIGRREQLKGHNVGSDDRARTGFHLHLQDASGAERYLDADVVLDCSGTYGNPNYLGPGGVPALGERALRDRICWVIPDILGDDHDDFAGRTTMVVGAGYSAITTLNLLLELGNQAVGTHIVWVTRAGDAPYERVTDDPLPERDRLAALGNRLATEDDNVDYFGDAWIESLHATNDGRIRVRLREDGDPTVEVVVDNVVANVGYRPDTDLYRELQVHQCYASDGPMKLAAKLLAESGAGGDCLQQTSGGVEVLFNPEPDFYILGSKSYGRNSAFLLRIGLEQIDAVLEHIGGAPASA